jgi:hypothetical protein
MGEARHGSSDGQGAGRGAGKHLALTELEGWVRDGKIDTIIVAITDMQGRLMG